MAENVLYDYYYGEESSQFSFYRIPRLLITEERFKKVSTDAKLLYGLLLDRMGLSARNGWFDEFGRVYIYYTLNEIQEDLNCGHDKAIKLLAELDTKKGCGLIERVRQGQGKPAKIYVKKFNTREVPSNAPVHGSLEVSEAEVKTSENPKSALRKNGSQDIGKSDASYIKYNQTDVIYTDPSINPSVSSEPQGWIDRCECIAERKETLEDPHPHQTALVCLDLGCPKETVSDTGDSGASRRCPRQHGILTSKCRRLGTRAPNPPSAVTKNAKSVQVHTKKSLAGVFSPLGSLIRRFALSRPENSGAFSASQPVRRLVGP